ncbi:MAG: CRISPR-associated endonuclease Cas2 [Armatimonadota bacterium]
MNLIVTYDVNTLTKDGRHRLRKVAKICEGYGQRVQLSVFECSLNDTQLEKMRQRLLSIIHPLEDSLRLYRLRGVRDDVVESYGKDGYIDFGDETLLV